MYLEHFNLTRSPFEEKPDLEVFFPGGDRDSTYKALVKDILTGKPLIKFIGREGSGKTLICRLLANHSLPDHDIVYMDNPIGSFDDLLRIICLDLGMNPSGSHESVNFLEELRALITQRREEGKKVLVIVDEAEKLFLATLERLVRTICETEEASTLRIVLSGRPGLDVNLEQLSIYCANVDINAGHSLEPLNEEETGEYLLYRLEAAGLSDAQQDEIFSEAAVTKIHSSSQGNLRMINILAEEALQKSCTDKSFMVLLDHVEVEPESKERVNILDMAREKADFLYAACMENRMLAGAGLGAVVLIILISLLVSGGDKEPVPTAAEPESRLEQEQSPQRVAEPAIREEEPLPAQEVAEELPVPVQEQGEEEIEPEEIEELSVLVEEEPEEVIEPLETPQQIFGEESAAEIDEVAASPEPAEDVMMSTEDPAIVVVGPENKKRPVNAPATESREQAGEPVTVVEQVKPVKRTNLQDARVIANGRDGDKLFKDRRRASVSWLAEAYRGAFTIQLMMLTSNQAEQNLKKMLVEDQYFAIKENLYILRKKTTPPTLFVYYGIYPSMDQARHERNTMPVFLRKHHPYALAISDALKKTED